MGRTSAGHLRRPCAVCLCLVVGLPLWAQGAAGDAKPAEKKAAPSIVEVEREDKAEKESAPRSGTERRVKGRKGKTKVYVVTRGVGYPDATLTDRQRRQRRNKARRDALVEAQAEMLSVVSKFVLRSGQTVGQAMKNDKEFVTKVNDAVSKADIESLEWGKDDSCTIGLRLDKKEFQDAIGAKVLR